MKEFDRFIEEAASKRCPPGKYYDGNKCVIPPRGFHVGRGATLEPDEVVKMEMVKRTVLLLMGIVMVAVGTEMVVTATVEMVEEATEVRNGT